MDTTTAPKTPPFEAVVKPAKEVFYVTVGLGVKAYEQLKSNRGELCGWFENQVADGKAQFETQATQIEERVGALLENVQDKLPEQAAELHEASPRCGQDRTRAAQGLRQPRHAERRSLRSSDATKRRLRRRSTRRHAPTGTPHRSPSRRSQPPWRQRGSPALPLRSKRRPRTR